MHCITVENFFVITHSIKKLKLWYSYFSYIWYKPVNRALLSSSCFSIPDEVILRRIVLEIKKEKQTNNKKTLTYNCYCLQILPYSSAKISFFFSFRRIGDVFYSGFKSVFLMQIGQFKLHYFWTKYKRLYERQKM